MVEVGKQEFSFSSFKNCLHSSSFEAEGLPRVDSCRYHVNKMSCYDFFMGIEAKHEEHTSLISPKHQLTVFIPTFNRSARLAKNIEKVLGEILKSGHEESVSLLVGDNSSTDNTFQVCYQFDAFAKEKKLMYQYFRNSRNLGMGGNIVAGLDRINGGYVLLLSDDDELYEGALTKVLSDILEFQPSVAIYNFNQEPYSTNNPLHKIQEYTSDSIDFKILSSLLIWPKLTGIVVNTKVLELHSDEFHPLVKNSKYYPHVSLVLFCFLKSNGLLKSKFFLAGPDADYREHFNFPWYVGAHLLHDIRVLWEQLEIQNPSFDKVTEDLKKIDVLDLSVNQLISFYQGKAKVTRSVKITLWRNIARFLMFKKTNSEGLKFDRQNWRTVIQIPYLVILSLFSNLYPPLGRKKKLMNEGF